MISTGIGQSTNAPGQIAVIGAGFSGLGVAGALKRHGIPFDVFEARPDLGGNWLDGVYENVHVISSRKTTGFAEYPMPDTYPDFPSAAQVLAYLRAYAERFELRPHVRFSTAVQRVEPDAEDSWAVTLSTGEVRTYRGVVVCTGQQQEPSSPKYPGAFSGEVLHSRQYREPGMLKDKRVLVVGGGNSACDIAVEAARFARSSHLSLKRGYWFLPRTIMGVPLPELTRGWMPLRLQRLVTRTALALVVGDYRKYGLPRPDHRLFDHHPTINSDLLHYLRLGRITPHPEIRRLDGGEVEFTDGFREAFDLIIYATGFRTTFSFLPDGLLERRNGVPQLIAGFIHPSRKNLFFLELHVVRYGVGPLISAEAEAVCALLRAQEQMAAPVPTVLKRLGYRPSKTLMCGPFEVISAARRLARLAPWLPRLSAISLRLSAKEASLTADSQ